MRKQRYGRTTGYLHRHRSPKDQHGFVNTPVYHGSTVIYRDLAALEQSYKDKNSKGKIIYGRRGNPTAFALEDSLAELEGGYAGMAMPSGLAAISTTLLALLKAGDHLLMVDTVYQPARGFCENILVKQGVEVSYYDPLVGKDIANVLQNNTRCIYMESPGSLTFEIQDVPGICEIAIDRGITTVLDNTWASPWFFRPLDHGVDVSITSATKFISGHSDVMMGMIVTNEPHYQSIRNTKDDLGQCVGPDDVYLVLRGLRTLGLRMEQHQKSGLKIAQWLDNHPMVTRVIHPAMVNCPGHVYWKRDFSGCSGLFGFEMKARSNTALANFVDHLEWFKMGASWGGYESLLVPCSPVDSRTATQWDSEDQLFRIHVGLENVEDLITDLEQGFERYSSTH